MLPDRSVLLPAFWLICATIVYGSLFPFHFSLPLAERGMPGFLSSWRTATGFGDILGNAVLFFPFGLIASLLAAQNRNLRRSALMFGLLGLAIALFCQLGQLFIPGRDPSIFDLYLNLIGASLGWFAGRLLPIPFAAAVPRKNTFWHLPLLLALCWLAYQLIPFVPTLDLQVFKNSLKPLLLSPRWQWQNCLVETICWLAFFFLIHHRAGIHLRAVFLLGLVLAILLLKVVIVENYLRLATTLAPMFALAVWIPLRDRLRGDWLALALLVSFALDVLAPLTLRPHARAFGWFPFEGYLHGSMLLNATALCRKLFVFGALILLLVQDRPQRLWLALAIAILLLLLEVLQRWIGYGTPTLTDPLLFLTMALFVAAHGAIERPAATTQGG